MLLLVVRLTKEIPKMFKPHMRTNMPGLANVILLRVNTLRNLNNSMAMIPTPVMIEKSRVDGTAQWIAEQKVISRYLWLKDENAVEAADLPAPGVLAVEAQGELSHRKNFDELGHWRSVRMNSDAEKLKWCLNQSLNWIQRKENQKTKGFQKAS